MSPFTCAGQFELKQVGNSENRFSNHKDHYLNSMIQLLYLHNFDRRIKTGERFGRPNDETNDGCLHRTSLCQVIFPIFQPYHILKPVQFTLFRFCVVFYFIF